MPKLRKRKDDTFVPAILLFKGRGAVSRGIRWWTFSQYSHAAILMPDGNIIESWQGKGVQIKKVTDWSNVEVFYVKGMSEAQWDKAIHFAKSQLGKGYDYWAIFSFIGRTKAKNNSKWFCSELVFSALLHAGVCLLKRVHPARVSPAFLSMSPLMDDNKDEERLRLTDDEGSVLSQLFFKVRQIA